MSIFPIKFAFSCIFSFFITFYLVPIFCKIAIRFSLVDRPDGSIKKHKKATPYLGGVAVYCGFLCGLAFSLPLENKILLFLIGATLLLFVGLIDDLIVLSPLQKIIGQGISALCFLKAGLHLKQHFFSHLVYIPFSFIWILTIINAFNLVDIMDGLASTVSCGAAISFLVISLLLGNHTLSIILCSFLGSLLAFLWYNRPQARIYLGDAGSLFVGGILSVIPFFLDWGVHNIYGCFVPVIVLAIPLLEICSLMCIRTYKGIPFYRPSPHHFALLLKNSGWTNYAILGYILGMSLFLGMVSVLFLFNIVQLVTTLIIGIIFFAVWIVMFFAK